MLRFAILVIALYGIFCGVALGQTTTPPKASTSSSTRERPAGAPIAQPGDGEAAIVVRPGGGGSLMRAAMTAPAQPDPARQGVKNFSVFAVPEPEPKTVKKHDLVTIIIREESEMNSQGTSDLKRQSDLDAKVDAMVTLSLKNFGLTNGLGNGPTPEAKLSGTRNFKGEATVNRTDSVTTRITAQVVDVKPNGTLVLEARKKIKTDEEEQTFIMSGVARVEDITPDNSVLSTQLFDLEFQKNSKGQVKNTTRTGLIHKLLDFINPF